MMANDLSYALRRMASTWIMAVLVLGGFFTVLGFGPEVEPAIRPVLTNQSSSVIDTSNGRVVFDLRLYKARPCRIVDADWVVQQGERATGVRVFRADGEPSNGTASYSTGWATLGPFTLTLPPGFKDPDLIYAILHYDCHPGWLTRQILGPVRLR